MWNTDEIKNLLLSHSFDAILFGIIGLAISKIILLELEWRKERDIKRLEKDILGQGIEGFRRHCRKELKELGVNVDKKWQREINSMLERY